MSEVRRWEGLPPQMEGRRVAYCPKCGAPVLDTEAALREHDNRVHRKRGLLIRMPTTQPLEKLHARRLDGDSRTAEEDACLCGACRMGQHLLCDGGSCRCVCALELDEIKRKPRRGAAPGREH